MTVSTCSVSVSGRSTYKAIIVSDIAYFSSLREDVFFKISIVSQIIEVCLCSLMYWKYLFFYRLTKSSSQWM